MSLFVPVVALAGEPEPLYGLALLSNSMDDAHCIAASEFRNLHTLGVEHEEYHAADYVDGEMHQPWCMMDHRNSILHFS